MNVFIQTRVAVFICLMMTVSTNRSTTCREPDNAELDIANALYDLYTDPYYSNFTLNIVPCFLERFPATSTLYENQAIPNSCTAARRNENCIDGELGGSEVTNDVPKSCHWEYMLDVEENRIPRVIAKAQCTCLHCHRGTCRHIYAFVPVLFKRCYRVTGVYTYRKSIMRVPVGCSCFLSGRASEPDSYSRRLVMGS